MPDDAGTRWQREQELLDRALDLPADERSAFLEHIAESDPSSAAAIRRLIEAHEKASFLDRSAMDFAATLNEPSDAHVAGRRIGPWRISRELGRGGMGVVYLAERADGQFRQQVALKLAREALPTPDSEARFLRERQVLASLAHPDIARLLDGGVTSEGTPYFAMELVDGERIDRWCDAQNLDVEQRLRLFARVCDAVQYAHGRLIIHRDLKPSNILVTANGDVRLLDFGVAKILDPALDPDFDDPVTRTGVRPLTPEYASPEQLRGDAVGTATDIYSLGCLLYTLLTGRGPHADRRTANVLVDETPPAPSDALLRSGGEHAARRARRIRGDLDTIVLKAMHPEPERRYGTAAELAADVRRHLAGLPVEARPDGMRYRAAKFVRRHRIGVAVSAGFVLLLTATAWITSVQGIRIRQQAQAIAAERDRAEEVSQFLVDVFAAADPAIAQGDTVTALQLLDRAADRVHSELENQPLRQADMLHVMGRVYQNLGQYDRARSLLQSAFDLRSARLEATHPDVATSRESLGILAQYDGRLEEAEQQLRAALAARRAAPQDQAALGITLHNLAGAVHLRGNLDDAESLYREALDVLRRAHGGRHTTVALTMTNLGAVLRARGELAQADSMYAGAIAIQRAVLSPSHPELATTLNNLGVLRIQLGELEAAEPVLREALDIRRRVLPPEHPATAQTVNNMAVVLERLGDLAGAEPLYREALALKRATLGDRHPSTATSANNLALLLQRRGEFDEAEQLYRESLETRRIVYGAQHPAVARALYNLAGLEEERGRITAAEQLYRQALDMRRTTLGAEHGDVAQAALALGRLLLTAGRPADAEPLLREAVDVGGFALGPDFTAEARALLDRCLAAL